MTRNTPISNEPRHAYKLSTTERILANTMLALLLMTTLLTVGMTLAPSRVMPALVGTVIATGIGGSAAITLVVIPQTLDDLHII